MRLLSLPTGWRSEKIKKWLLKLFIASQGYKNTAAHDAMWNKKSEADKLSFRNWSFLRLHFYHRKKTFINMFVSYPLVTKVAKTCRTPIWKTIVTSRCWNLPTWLPSELKYIKVLPCIRYHSAPSTLLPHWATILWGRSFPENSTSDPVCFLNLPS